MADRQGIMAGRAFVEFTLSDAALIKGLQNAQKRLEAFGNGLAGVGKKIAGVGLAVTVPMIAAAKSFASYGKNLAEVSARTNVAGSSLSELGYAAKETGSSLEDLESGLRTMQLRLLDARGGSEAVKKTLADMGLTIEALSKLSPEKQFEAIATALSKIKDPAKQAKLGLDLFGKSAVSLRILLAGGAAAIKALREEAKRTGGVVSDEDIQAAEELDGAFGRITTSVNAMYVRIGAALAPALTALLDIIQPIVMAIADWLRANKDLVVDIAKAGVAAIVAGGAIYGLGMAFKFAATALSGIAAVAGLFGSGAFMAAFWIALGGAVLYFGSSFTSLGDIFAWVRERFEDIKTVASDMATGIAEALSRGDIKAAANLLWAGLVLIWEQQTSEIKIKTQSMIDDVKTKLAEGVATLKTFASEINRGRETAGRWLARGGVEVASRAMAVKNFGKKLLAGAEMLGNAGGGWARSGDEGPVQASVDRSMVRSANLKIAADLKKEIAADEQWITDMRKELDKQQQDHAEEGAAAQRKITEELVAQLEAIKAQRAESEQAAKDRLAAAQAEFDKAKNAAMNPSSPKPDAPPPVPKTPELPDANDLPDIDRSSVSGSRAIFGGDLAGQIFGGDSYEKKNYDENKRAREAAERMDKRLEQIERNKSLLVMG